MNRIITYLVFTMFFVVFWTISSCLTNKRLITGVQKSDTLYTVTDGEGYDIEFHFEKGAEHNYPLMALWTEDTNGNYLQTLYVAESIAKGVFDHGQTSQGKWLPGAIRRPAALPVWSHQRGVKEEDGLFVPTQKTAVPDAYTGATPMGDFILSTRTESKEPRIFNLYFEINQSWDWNEYWTNNKFPGNEDYKSSCQPSLVYMIRIDAPDKEKKYDLKLIGHGHYAGSDGKIYKDLSTFTTALEITGKVFAITSITEHKKQQTYLPE